ncbi:PEST proteolytic signal-containing nuclear protein-like [Galleria mellonella]|uniref:PEST proteolytic signal-containing nuclear protein n=1 Tax=Galleria mellonella TaxID=7137 RepID=A0A6J1WMF8_GALME|nr:PEST proteolytic signal-containing nuclear protein-like [Galleria mellonella]
MSSRYHDYNKGSSRSTRDDSRAYSREERWEGHGKRRSRSRSRSPRKESPPSRSSKYSSERSRSHEKDRRYEDKRIEESNYDWENSDDEVPAPPPPPRITKISIGFTKPKAPIKMNLSNPAKVAAGPVKATIASVFNDDDDDDEPEEMPAEARMRMRNIGRETPTSAGPNSFGKTKQGFCDAKKVFEKNLKQALETAEKPPMPKFPQTIYKIKGP